MISVSDCRPGDAPHKWHGAVRRGAPLIDYAHTNIYNTHTWFSQSTDALALPEWPPRDKLQQWDTSHAAWMMCWAGWWTTDLKRNFPKTHGWSCILKDERWATLCKRCSISQGECFMTMFYILLSGISCTQEAEVEAVEWVGKPPGTETDQTGTGRWLTCIPAAAAWCGRRSYIEQDQEFGVQNRLDQASVKLSVKKRCLPGEWLWY